MVKVKIFDGIDRVSGRVRRENRLVAPSRDRDVLSSRRSVSWTTIHIGTCVRD